MSLTLTGTIKKIGATDQVSDKFKKREIVITDDSNNQYPQHIQLQASQDRCEMLDSLKVGDKVTVHFNLRGREWTSPQGEVKYFNTLDIWKIASNGAGERSEPATQSQDEYVPDQGNDTLPF